jgi:hypothetical protein
VRLCILGNEFNPISSFPDILTSFFLSRSGILIVHLNKEVFRIQQVPSASRSTVMNLIERMPKQRNSTRAEFAYISG